MFTGIIIGKGKILSVTAQETDRIFKIRTPFDMTSVDIGASIACSGCCLTVTEKGPDWFTVYVSGETLSKTNLGEWVEGTEINLERSLRLGDEMGGHIVSGHVDGLAIVKSIETEGESWRFKIETPRELEKFVAAKGSVALDGTSLTVNHVEGNVFDINIIPHTLAVTTLGQRKVGDKLNMEFDMLARYVARMMD
ncbi:MAG: riboflavin synthase [Micavibrio aeruginosavorus]|uniref:Riboflavin synthase n=1 Tax=Micavibrio aeruginosavorus TaxID=349221 RepID=A0A2W5HIN2_9BACT|nr:MAG: riboflavin synthase [Micavibrio aeruginosavorus]